MFTISNALKNIRRYCRKSAMYFLICVIAVLTLQIYISGIDKTEKNLKSLPDALPISANVASLDGSRFTGLQISDLTVTGLQKSAHVRDLLLSYFLGGWIGESQDDISKNRTGLIAGVNTVLALDGFDSDTVDWLPGYISDFVGGEDAVCLVDLSLAKTYNWSLGDIISINPYALAYDDKGVISDVQLGTQEFHIIGVANLSAVTSNKLTTRIIIPFEAGRAIFKEQNAPFHATSASFYVRDALNINDFKTEMGTISLSQVLPIDQVYMMVIANRGTALVVNDAAFVTAATRLQETLSLLNGFLPLLIAVLAAIGYFVAYLMIQTRREEYAVLRLLGLGKWRSMGLYFAEIATLTLSGSLCGVLISAAVGIGNLNVGVLVFALFSLCFILGSVIALFRLGRTNVMLALAQAE